MLWHDVPTSAIILLGPGYGLYNRFKFRLRTCSAVTVCQYDLCVIYLASLTRTSAMTLEYEFRRRSEGWPLRPLSWTSDDVTALQPAHKSPYLILLIWTRLAICAIKHIVWNRLVFHTCIMCRALLSWLHFSNTSTVSNKTFLSHFCLISVYSLVPNRLSIY